MQSTTIDHHHLLALTTEFRDHMDYTADPHEIANRFAGTCYTYSRSLVATLRNCNFPAKLIFGFYQIQENLLESHAWVVVGPYYVDVTADQFHPADPATYRVVVIHRDNNVHPYHVAGTEEFEHRIELNSDDLTQTEHVT